MPWWLLLMWMIGEVSPLEFQGCFEDLDFSDDHLSRDFENFNLNADCASFCASQGYILAATHREMCYCTNKIPSADKLIKSPSELKYIDGTEDNPCNSPCPGSLANRGGTLCVGDECCGGLRRQQKKYSLYAVGGIDPVNIYLRRIYRSLFNRKHPWMDVDINGIDPICYDNFFLLGSGGHGWLKMQYDEMSIRDYRIHPASVPTVEQCQEICESNSGFICLSVTYFFKEKRCYLNKMSTWTGQVTLSEKESAVYDRNCSYAVDVVPTSFEMDVMRQKVSEAFNHGGSIEADVDSEDIEVDLTDSSNWETTDRTVAVTTSSDISQTTQSGFVSSRSTTSSEETSQETSERLTHESSTTHGKSAGFGFSVGASASVGFGPFSASVETQATSDFESSSSETEGSSSSKGSSSGESRGSSQSKSRSDMFNYGYSKGMQQTELKSYQFSMTVPAFHKGILSFFVQKTTLDRKITTDMRLNGYLTLNFRDRNGNVEERDVHVARVLPPKDRYLMVYTEVAYQRQVLLGKITIRDKDGNPIIDEDQVVPQE